jgi:hypothetical protein
VRRILKAIDRLGDRFVEWLILFAARTDGRLVAVLAVIAYAGIGLAIPLGLGLSVVWVVAANLWGTFIAGVLLLGWLTGQIRAAQRRHLVEWTSDLRLLTAEEFEWLVGELYRREGWKVTETGRHGGPDGNVDLRIERNGVRGIVQCKKWQSWRVGVDEIREFGGTLLREGLSGRSGTFVTLSTFTEAAIEEADTSHITLVDNHDLYSRIEKVRRAEPCPICGQPMILDRSRRGWWFRCITPRCAGKRDLGADPGRAIEFLTEQADSTGLGG